MTIEARDTITTLQQTTHRSSVTCSYTLQQTHHTRRIIILISIHTIQYRTRQTETDRKHMQRKVHRLTKNTNLKAI